MLRMRSQRSFRPPRHRSQTLDPSSFETLKRRPVRWLLGPLCIMQKWPLLWQEVPSDVSVWRAGTAQAQSLAAQRVATQQELEEGISWPSPSQQAFWEHAPRRKHLSIGRPAGGARSSLPALSDGQAQILRPLFRYQHYQLIAA